MLPIFLMTDEEHLGGFSQMGFDVIFYVNEWLNHLLNVQLSRIIYGYCLNECHNTDKEWMNGYLSIVEHCVLFHVQTLLSHDISRITVIYFKGISCVALLHQLLRLLRTKWCRTLVVTHCCASVKYWKTPTLHLYRSPCPHAKGLYSLTNYENMVLVVTH